MQLKNPLMIALDVDTDTEAERLVGELAGVAGCFKLGPRLIHRYGQSFVQKIAKQGPVFVDCKFFDIPSTMEAAIRATFDSGATFATIHAMAGPTALARLAQVESELNKIRPFMILCVSILTSWSEKDFSENFQKKSIQEHVQILAAQAKAAGLKGLVCSPHELAILQGKGHYLVTPGVRLSTEPADDQTRIMSPTDALAGGASAYVVGRPIIQSKSPKNSARTYLPKGTS